MQRNATIVLSFVLALGALGAVNCATTATTRSAAQPAAETSSKCPAPGTTVPLGKVMNPAFIRDYQGCDVVVEAQFLKLGNEGYMLGQYDTSSNATFQVLEPGGTAQASLGGMAFGKFCGIAKSKSDVLFSLKEGDKVRLRGAPVGYFAGGSLVVGVFDAGSVERAP